MSKYSIKIISDGRISTIESDNHILEIGNEILVDSKNGPDIAQVVPQKTIVEKETDDSQNNSDSSELEFVFVRKLNEKDNQQIAELKDRSKKYLKECNDKVKKYQLPMQLLDADLSFDEKRLTIYFTAPSRVDFRVLVSDLAHSFKKIIRLQQVGARDEARYLGGVGRCGQHLCCKRFLKGNLESVTLDMAIDQNLAQMGSNRVTGACGKLMCCLKFELETYKESKKELPAIGSEIKTKQGTGVVLSQNPLKKSCMVKLKDSESVVEEFLWK